VPLKLILGTTDPAQEEGAQKLIQDWTDPAQEQGAQTQEPGFFSYVLHFLFCANTG